MDTHEPTGEVSLSKEDRVGHLVSRITELATADDRDSQAFQQRALQLMTGVESAREELGINCVTIGEGEDRVVLFSDPVQRTSDQKMDITLVPLPGSHSGQPKDMGDLHTEYEEYLFINRLGVNKLSIIVDQQGELDPASPLFQPDKNPSGFPNISNQRQWMNRAMLAVQAEAKFNKGLLAQIMQSKTFFTNPDVRSGKQFLKPAEFHLTSRLAEMSDDLQYGQVSPSIVDTILDEQQDEYFYTGHPRVVRVVKPEFVSQAVGQKISA